MKIVLLTTYLSNKAGGLANSVPGLARSLKNIGIDVSVVGLKPRNGILGTGYDNDFTIGCRSYGLERFGYAPQLKNTLKNLEPDLIHLQHIWMYASFANRAVCRDLGIPYVISPRGMLDPWALKQSRIKKSVFLSIVEKQHIDGASSIHVLNKSEAEAVQHFGYKGKISIVPNGIDLKVHTPTRNIPQKKRLLFLGRIDQKKGLVELLNGWLLSRNKPNAKDWTLTIAGYGDSTYTSKINNLIIKLKIADSVEMIGPVFGNEKHELLHSSHAFILPSLSEGLPMSVLEAWSYRLPTLITRQCNIPESFKLNASIEITSDRVNISNNLNLLFAASQKELDSYSSNAVELVKDKFLWSKVALDMQSAYQEILEVH